MTIQIPRTNLAFSGTPEQCATLAVQWYSGSDWRERDPYRNLPWPFNVELPSMKKGGRRW